MSRLPVIWKRLGLVVLLVFFTLCFSRYLESQQIKLDYRSLKTGDVILTKGYSFFSYGMRILHPTKIDYSHVGIVYIKNDSVFIINATPTPVNMDQNDHVVIELLEAHISSNRVQAASIYRMQPDQWKLIPELVNAAIKNSECQTEFDRELSLTNDVFYCTEFVSKCFDDIDLSLVCKDSLEKYLYPKDLVSNNVLSPVYSVQL